jgi:hypothetical protein
MVFEVVTPPLASDAVVSVEGFLDCEDGTRTAVSPETAAGSDGWRQLCRERASSAPPEFPADVSEQMTGLQLELRAGRVPRLADGQVLADGRFEHTRGRRLVDLCTGEVLLDLSGTPLQFQLFGNAAHPQYHLSPAERAYLLSRRGLGTRYVGLTVEVVPVDPTASWRRLWPTLREELARSADITRALFSHPLE